MGIYFNPPLALVVQGRLLQYGNFEKLVAQLEQDEHLYGLYDRGIFMNEPNLFSEAEMAEFERQVNEGIIFQLGYFALPSKFAPPGSQ